MVVRIEVTDTGPGIPLDRLNEIFEPFERLNDKGGPTKGSGLGLAIARNLLRLMGGDLVARSNVGAGSIFVCTLVARAVEDDASLRGRRILVVDDDAVCLRVTTWLLESLGCSVDGAGGGIEAVELASARSYDVILLDCNMPDLSGVEAARRIRSKIGPTVRIVAFTAGAESREGAVEAGMNDFLQKPVDRENLRASLMKHLRATAEKQTPAARDVSSSA